MNKQFCAIAVGVLAFCAISSMPARAYSWSTCDRYETYTENGYNLYTDEWGASSGQCVYANSSTNWWSVANFPSGSGVQAYPDSEISIGNVNLSSLSAVNSSFNFSVPNAPWYDAAYDLWTNGNVDEVMVWEDWNGNGPIASSYSCNQLGVSGCPFATNVSIDGVAYDVFQGNTGHNVVSFLRISKTTSGSVNLLDLMNWLANEGKLNSKTFSTADFGFEIGDTNGSQTFTLNSFSVSTSSGGGSCTPTTITPYVSVNNGSSWAEETAATVSSTSTQVDLGPQPASGGSWSWSGPNGYTSTARQIDDVPLKTGSNVYTATYTNGSGCKSSQAFTIKVN
jgi:zinc protease